NLSPTHIYTLSLHDALPIFGSILVSASGQVLFEDRNRVAGGDHTRHPEFAIARWAAENLSTEARAAATVYTSGEHCPMCAAAHGDRKSTRLNSSHVKNSYAV